MNDDAPPVPADSVQICTGNPSRATGSGRAFEFGIEAFNLTNTPSFGPPARDINAPNMFGQIASTISAPRTIELVLKFFF